MTIPTSVSRYNYSHYRFFLSIATIFLSIATIVLQIMTIHTSESLSTYSHCRCLFIDTDYRVRNEQKPILIIGMVDCQNRLFHPSVGATGSQTVVRASNYTHSHALGIAYHPPSIRGPLDTNGVLIGLNPYYYLLMWASETRSGQGHWSRPYPECRSCLAHRGAIRSPWHNSIANGYGEDVYVAGNVFGTYGTGVMAMFREFTMFFDDRTYSVLCTPIVERER